jgi:hypothetical protein
VIEVEGLKGSVVVAAEVVAVVEADKKKDKMAGQRWKVSMRLEVVE